MLFSVTDCNNSLWLLATTFERSQWPEYLAPLIKMVILPVLDSSIICRFFNKTPYHTSALGVYMDKGFYSTKNPRSS